MKFPSRAAALVVLFAITGCADFRSKVHGDTASQTSEQKYASYALEDLLGFAADIARMPPAERLSECQQLLQDYRVDRSLGVRLHVFFAQAVTEACGDIRNAIGIADASLAELHDERLKSLLIYQKEILSRIDTEIERRKSSERQVSHTVSKEKKVHRQLKTQESELKELQEKLDALKAIEQRLDEPKIGQ
ncbi:surface protein-related protein [Methylocaldum marinum]|uniref:Surface protein-related protein n=1 Tax=Methylocaldum marinum TaxID=1432792 RepID=A0A250L0D3_9GAMM|nr:hypothetical protein [Methylocaldum marinum]BBA36701.1 surface protein-related protein [Methylocaldum marinum]